MPALDPKKAKANIAIVKTALKKAEAKKDGKGVRVGFAFAPGKDKHEHILLVDPRKKGQALMAEIVKGHKDRKVLCCGHATVEKDGSKKTMSIVFVKKLGGAERKMQEALKAMSLMYLVKLEKEEEDEDIAEAIGEAVEDALDDQGGDDDDARDADAGDDDDEDRETAAAGDDDASDDKDADAGEDEDDDEDDDEDADTDEEADAPAAHTPKGAPPAAAAKLAAIGAAPKVWHQTRGVMNKSIESLRAAIKKEYASEAPELNAEIDKGIAQMNRIMEKLDHKLAEQIEKAHKAKDEATRKAELAKAQNILKEHIKYVQSEPLIAHIDSNPFGVQTNLKKTLMMSFTHVAKVIS